ncbi:hypothetical protein DV736_g1985, partial [Chaetothyriales sp. CBS 134916]
MPSKALLGKVASVLGLAGSGMTWAANKLHSRSEDQDEADPCPTSASIGEIPKPSPRKVRFVSRAHRPRSISTMPIDIPKKPIPSLPPLQLPKAPIMDNLGHGTRPDPIPSARPPDTPVLKAQRNDGYIGLPSPNQDLDALPSPLNIQRDHANIEQNQCTIAASVVKAVESLELARNTTQSESWVPTTKDDGQEQLAARPVSSEDSSVVLPYVDVDLVMKGSYSACAEGYLSSEQLPSKIETHEDTRQRFRGWSGQKVVDGWPSSESDSTNMESPNEFCRVFLGPSSHQQDVDYLQHQSSATRGKDSGIFSIRDTLESMSLTDTVKLSSTQPSPPEKPVTTSGNIATAIPLTPTTASSVSPTRSRRPFRFSNTAEQKPEVDPCGNTSSAGKRSSTEQTPSPVSLPLPLSIPPKRIIGKISPASFTPPPKWSPFQEDGFLYALAVATSCEAGVAHVHETLSSARGFAKLWDFLQLPKCTMPDSNASIPTSEEISDMIKTAQEACKSSAIPVDHHGWSPFDEILFPGALVNANNDLGPTVIYQCLSTEGGFKNLWKVMRLPNPTAPKDDTRLLHEEECQDMVMEAWRICGQSSDQYGWLPFAETDFPSALISAISATGYDHVSSLLVQDGGIAKFWKKAMLPRNTAPQEDTRALTPQEINTMVQKAHRVCGYKREINPDADNIFQYAIGPVPRSSPASIITEHRILSSGSDCWPRRQQQYSGEVSTVDFPLDSVDQNGGHEGHKNDSWSYPWCSECQSVSYGGSLAGDGPSSLSTQQIAQEDEGNGTPRTSGMPTWNKANTKATELPSGTDSHPNLW